MVTRAECAQVAHVVRARHRRVLLGNCIELVAQRLPRLRHTRRDFAPGAAVVAATVVRTAVRYRLLDRRTHRCQVVRQVVRRQRRLRRHHAAADVDADRRRDDRARRRNDAADRCTLACMHVRHHRHPLVDERQARHVQHLLACLVLERYALGPGLHRHTVTRVDNVVSRVLGHGFILSRCRSRRRSSKFISKSESAMCS